MAVARRALAPLLKSGRDTLTRPGKPIGGRRCFASVASSTSEGPLAGLRVLDMTRVLAGVCTTFAPEHIKSVC